MIRLAEEKDFAEMLEIYQNFVKNTSITIDATSPTLADFSDSISTEMKTAPCLVCEIAGQIVGYAFAKKFRPQMAYDSTRELTIYVNPLFKAKKVGMSLYLSLIELLRLQNYRQLIAAITLPNIPSVAFHERLGFMRMGVLEHIGIKFGKPHHLGWWQLSLKENNEPILPIIPYSTILKSKQGKNALQKGMNRLLF